MPPPTSTRVDEAKAYGFKSEGRAATSAPDASSTRMPLKLSRVPETRTPAAVQPVAVSRRERPSRAAEGATAEATGSGDAATAAAAAAAAAETRSAKKAAEARATAASSSASGTRPPPAEEFTEVLRRAADAARAPARRSAQSRRIIRGAWWDACAVCGV